MAILSQPFGQMQQNPFVQYQQMQANPFTRQIPGTQYLNQPMQGMSPMGGAPGAMPMNPMGMGQMQPQMGAPRFNPRLGTGNLPQGESVVPTDFAGVPPGLPNLPQDLQGFGFGQMAPKMNVNTNLRSNLIQQLLQQLMQGDGFNQQGGGF